MHIGGISEIATFSFLRANEWFTNYSFFGGKYFISEGCAYITTAKHYECNDVFINRHGMANEKWKSNN